MSDKQDPAPAPDDGPVPEGYEVKEGLVEIAREYFREKGTDPAPTAEDYAKVGGYFAAVGDDLRKAMQMVMGEEPPAPAPEVVYRTGGAWPDYLSLTSKRDIGYVEEDGYTVTITKEADHE